MHHLRSFYGAVNNDHQKRAKRTDIQSFKSVFCFWNRYALTALQNQHRQQVEISVNTYLDGMDEDLCYTYI